MESTTPQTASSMALDVHDRIVEALELDLVGPWPGHELADEKLPGRARPSNWYLTGFLVPLDTPADESGPTTRAAARPTRRATASTRRSPTSGRAPREQTVDVPLGLGGRHSRVLAVAESGGLELHVLERPVQDAGADGRIPPGTRSVSVFLVNHRPAVQKDSDRAYAFQPVLTVRCDEPFVPRPDLRGAHAADWEEEMADLHYADTPEYATGHGISADWTLIDRECRELRTSWIPRAIVEKTQTAPDARGYFLGDYTGLTASGTTFDPFFMMSHPIATKGLSDPFANQAH